MEWPLRACGLPQFMRGIGLKLPACLIGCGILLLAVGSHAAEPEYAPDVAKWQEIRIPPNDRNSDRAAWDYAANYSELSWRVYLDNGKPYAKLIHSPNDDSSEPAPFDARADNFRGATRFREVDDGWLVAFNHGEFGAALYWFDRSGIHHYKISNHQVVSFLSLSDGIYAIEGLAHMGASCGSVIRISRPIREARWQATRVVRLPYAPSTAVVRRDDSMVVALSHSLVSVGPDHQIRTLIADAPWGGLYPSSSIVLPDESRLYLGMRQFVAEIDLSTNQLRLLVPSTTFLNKLPDDQEARIRKQYSRGMSNWRPPNDLCEQLEKAHLRNDR
jgi:hypothetical protein